MLAKERLLHSPSVSPRALMIFIIYRLCLSFGLLLFFLLSLNFYSTIISAPLFIGFACAYIIFSILCALIEYHTKLPLPAQVMAHVLLDIFFLSALMMISHHNTHQFATLINIAIAAGSILVSGRISLFFSAVATFSLFIVHFFFVSMGYLNLFSYSEVSFWGAIFFATAIVAYVLSLRVTQSELLAEERSVDLKKMQTLTAHIISDLRQGVLVVDRQSRVCLMNPAASDWLGIPKTTKILTGILPDFDRLFDDWKTKTSMASDILMIKNTEGVSISAQLTSLDAQGTVLLFLDDPTRVAEQAQAMKLLSLGRLSASIAHEIRNPLAAMLHAVQLLQESESLIAMDHRLSDIIQQEGLRINTIIENVLYLSSRKSVNRHVFCLATWLSSFVTRASISLAETDQIILHEVDPTFVVSCDESQLQQAVHNIVENGLRYSREHGASGGFVEICVYREEEQGHIVLDIIDKGPGISDENRQHIFEPFFTTNRQGSGLGLYISKELCEANHIRLQFFNVAAGGVCFRLTF